MANLTNINNKFLVTTGGNVGINTTSPDSKLDVTGGDITVNTTGTGFMNFKYSNSQMGTIGTDGVDLKITANADLQLLPTGNVGIGTTSPNAKLEVKDSANNNSNLLTLYRPNSSTLAASKLDFSFNTVNGTQAIYSRIQSDVDGNTDSAQSGSLSFWTPSSGTLSERMRITSGGNVGIGTNNPNVKLDIVGGNTTGARDVQISGDSSIIGLGTGGDNGPHGLSFGYDSSKTSGMSMYYRTGPEQISFEDNDDDSGSRVMVIGKDGNVGINETSPDALLDIEMTDTNTYDANAINTATLIAQTFNTSNVNNQASIISLRTTGWAGSTTGVVNIGAVQASGNASSADFVIQTRNAGTYGERMRIDSSGQITNTMSGGKVLTDTNGFITSFQTLDTATAGGRFIGKSNRGVLGSIHIEQTATGTDGGYIGFETSPNGSTTPTERMRIDSSGNVGIGITSPNSILHVGSTGTNAYSSTITKGSNMKGIMNTLSNNADDMVGIYFATGSTTEGTHWSGITGSRSDNASHWGTQLNFYTHNNDVANLNDATQKMVIKGDGKVGIGETSPLGKLHIKVSDTGVTSPSAQGNLLVLEDSENGLSILSSTAGAGYINFGDSDDNNVGMIIYGHSSNSMDFWTNAGKRMTIDSGGQAVFYGDVTLDSDSTKVKLGDNQDLQLYHDGSNSYIETTTGSAGDLYIKAQGTNHDLYLQTADQTIFRKGTAEAMRINDEGYLGIGTTDPDFHLDIAASGSGVQLQIGRTSSNVGSTWMGADSNGFHLGVGAYGAGNSVSNPNGFTVTSGGDVEITGGYSSSQSFQSTGSLRVSSNSTATTGNVALELMNDATGTRYLATFTNLNGVVGSISTYANATSYNTSSDYRLKENVVEMTGALNRVNELKPSRFNFIGYEEIVDGFLAHEVQDIVPEAITGTKDEIDEEGNPVYQGIDQSKLVPLLVGAIKELKADNDSLKARIETLENK